MSVGWREIYMYVFTHTYTVVKVKTTNCLPSIGEARAHTWERVFPPLSLKIPPPQLDMSFFLLNTYLS